MATTTARARIANARPSAPVASTPCTLPSPLDSSAMARVAGSSSTFAAAAARRRITAMIAAPLPSPPTCSTRARLCAASRCTDQWPASRANGTPRSSRKRIAEGASRQAMSAARREPSPQPASSVSSRCSAGLSSAATAAAMPPCARSLAVSQTPAASSESTQTRRPRAASAVTRPPRPAPRTSTSVSSSFMRPGAASDSACARRRGARRPRPRPAPRWPERAARGCRGPSPA